MHATIITSFTVDYSLGHVTKEFNQRYAEKHGYDFVCRIMPPWDHTDHSKRHPTWDKVALLMELLCSLLRGEATCCAPNTTHILWVDADAVIVNHAVNLESLWEGLPSSVELLIGEDVTPACLVNAGVLCVRVSEWSLRLWTDVWKSQSSAKFYRRRYHEQSALLRQLAVRGEGLDLLQLPFHSYQGGPELKVFPHVAVMPRHAFNTNRGDLRSSPPSGRNEREWRCDFIFHAAGHPSVARDGNDASHPPRHCGKLEAIESMLRYHGLTTDGEAIDAMRAQPCKRLRYPGRIMN